MAAQEGAPDAWLYMIPNAHEVADQGNVVIMEELLGPERVYDLLTTIAESGQGY